MSTETSAQFEAVHIAHVYVEQEEVEGCLGCQLEGRGGVAGGGDLPRTVVEDGEHEVEVILHVVNDEYPVIA
jgi:hypothetical protein